MPSMIYPAGTSRARRRARGRRRWARTLWRGPFQQEDPRVAAAGGRDEGVLWPEPVGPTAVPGGAGPAGAAGLQRARGPVGVGRGGCGREGARTRAGSGGAAGAGGGGGAGALLRGTAAGVG